MIHKACMPVYMNSGKIVADGRDGTGRVGKSKVLQEVLADLKTSIDAEEYILCATKETDRGVCLQLLPTFSGKSRDLPTFCQQSIDVCLSCTVSNSILTIQECKN